MLPNPYHSKIVQYNTCYLTKFQHVTPLDTIEFSGFQILRIKTAHAHYFIKIIFTHSHFQQLASQFVLFCLRAKRSLATSTLHRILYGMLPSFVVNPQAISLSLHYLPIADVVGPFICIDSCNDNKPVSLLLNSLQYLS